MRVAIREKEAILSLDPALLEAYLTSREWTSVRQVGNAGNIWRIRSADEDAEVLVPNRREIRDFPLRISETLRSLAKVERRSEFDLYQEILFADKDIVAIKIPKTDDRPDLQLAQTVALATNAREMMLAAACSVVSPKAVFMWRRPRAAKSYVEKLRAIQLGLDEPTVAVLSPVPSALRASPRSIILEPFGRRVVAGLANAFSTTEKLFRGEVPLDSETVASLVESGISANLYDSIGGMLSTESGSAKVRIEIRFAPIRSLPNPPSFNVSSAEVSILESTSERLRHEADEQTGERTTVTGSTVGLRRPTSSRRGQVTIEQPLRFGFVRRIRLQLEEADYQLAARAHLARSRVSVSGILRRRGRFWLLDQPQGFSVVLG